MIRNIEKRIKQLENSKNYLSQYTEHYTFYYKDGSIIELQTFETVAALKAMNETSIIDHITPHSNFIQIFLDDKKEETNES